MSTDEERVEQGWTEATCRAKDLHGKDTRREDIIYEMVKILSFKCLELEYEIENLRGQVLP